MPVKVKVGDVMTRSIIAVESEDPVWEAVYKMCGNNVGSVLVRRMGAYVGIVTERDVMKKVLLEALDPKSLKVSEVMSAPLVTVDAERPIGEASLLMLERKIRRLPVMRGGVVVGIVTERDLSRSTLDALMSMSALG